MQGEPIDLLHAGAARTVGVYLLDTSEGLSLFDCGPSSCIPALKDGLAERGVELGDLRNLLLSHIHLDHAGAAGAVGGAQRGHAGSLGADGAPRLSERTRLDGRARRR